MKRAKEKRPIAWIPVIPMLWLMVFLLVPYLIVLKLSFSSQISAKPPYEPAFSVSDSVGENVEKLKLFNVDNYLFLASDSIYWNAYVNSLLVAFVSTFFALLIGYPIAYGMSRAPPEWQPILLLGIAVPFWTSFLIRVYAVLGLIQDKGLINGFLMDWGIISTPIPFHDSGAAVYIGIVYTYLPFMILPLYAALEKMDLSLEEAAADLGCSRFGAFWRVTFPLSLPGVIAGCSLVMIPAIGEYVIPYLLGSSKQVMIGRVLYDEFFSNADWPVAAALATVLLVILIIPIMIFQHYSQRIEEAKA